MSSGLVYRRGLRGFLKVHETAQHNMLRFVQDQPGKPEAGGVLLGRHIRDTENIVVDSITTPVPEDFASRYRFFRSDKAHQRLIDDCWEKSRQTCTYLGEWHTHPESRPTPSFIDLCNWRRKLLFDQFSYCLFFVIVGTQKIHVWEGRSRCVRLFRLEAHQ